MSRKPNLDQVKEVFDEVEESFPEKSLEFQFQMTCDRYQMTYGREIDHSHVADALNPDRKKSVPHLGMERKHGN